MLARRNRETAPEEGGRSEPMRQCAVTRARAPQRSLLRLALGPDGQPYADVLGRAPGRGVYVTCAPDVLRKALGPKGIGRAFRGRAKALDAEAVEGLLEDTTARLEARLVELTGLARRAGALELGMDPVLRALSSATGPGWVVVVTRDLGAASLRKIEAAIAATNGRARVIRVGTKDVLGSRLGRNEVGVLAVRPSQHAERLASEADRWRGLLGEVGEGAPDPEIPLTDAGNKEQSVGDETSGERGAAGEVK